MGAESFRLGLTGGIGSGKSTVSAFLEQMGAAIIDADAISRATTGPGGAAIAALRVAFGASVLTADGAMDRAKMRKLVYSDPGAKTQLEAIIHPLVGQAVGHQALHVQVSGARWTVFDIPLLVESQHWRTKLDRILVIDCSEDTQVVRVAARNGLTHHEIGKILATQASRKQRLECADWVLLNDGISLDELRQHVQQIGTQFGL